MKKKSKEQIQINVDGNHFYREAGEAVNGNFIVGLIKGLPQIGIGDAIYRPKKEVKQDASGVIQRAEVQLIRM